MGQLHDLVAKVGLSNVCLGVMFDAQLLFIKNLALFKGQKLIEKFPQLIFDEKLNSEKREKTASVITMWI